MAQPPTSFGCLWFVYDDVAPRSAIATQLTTKVAASGMGHHWGVTDSRIGENHKVHHQEVRRTMLVLQERFTIFRLLFFVVFWDWCVAHPKKQINAKIMFHVCSLLVVSESPSMQVTPRTHQNLQPETNNILQEIIQRILEMPCFHSSKPKWAAASWKKKQTPLNTEWLPFRTHSHREFSGRKWRECGRNRGKYEKMNNI